MSVTLMQSLQVTAYTSCTTICSQIPAGESLEDHLFDVVRAAKR
jgi:hypothetical protein